MGIEQLKEAIRLTRKGWVIHPLAGPKATGGSPGKRPLLNSWQKRRKATEAELKEWFEKTEKINIKLKIGASKKIKCSDGESKCRFNSLFFEAIRPLSLLPQRA